MLRAHKATATAKATDVVTYTSERQTFPWKTKLLVQKVIRTNNIYLFSADKLFRWNTSQEAIAPCVGVTVNICFCLTKNFPCFPLDSSFPTSRSTSRKGSPGRKDLFLSVFEFFRCWWKDKHDRHTVLLSLVGCAEDASGPRVLQKRKTQSKLKISSGTEAAADELSFCLKMSQIPFSFRKHRFIWGIFQSSSVLKYQRHFCIRSCVLNLSEIGEIQLESCQTTIGVLISIVGSQVHCEPST